MIIDRGFDAMIPKPKQKEKIEYYVNHNIRFKFLKAEFNLSFNVKKLRG